MTKTDKVTITLDRRLLEHPSALHMRRMRSGLWLYLDLLTRLPAEPGSIEIEPGAVGREMGLPEGTIRSWLGHLSKGGYLSVKRLNGTVWISRPADEMPRPDAAPAKEKPTRYFTAAKLALALGDRGDTENLQAALNQYSDDRIRHALAGALAVPEDQIRRSRTALFIYLLKRHDQA